VAVGVAPQVLGFLLGPPARQAKNSPYECGFEAFEDARMKFDVRYYLVAILFILFDLEIAFPLPVGGGAAAKSARSGFWAMMVFLASSSWASSTSGRRAPSTGNTADRWALKAFSRKASSPSLGRQAGQLVQDRLAVADDLRPGLLRGRDDARRRRPATTSTASACCSGPARARAT
jgi:NADH-quinone oxidoreductase subunit A